MPLTYHFDTQAGCAMVLAPIRGSLDPATAIAVANKAALVDQQQANITHINGRRVYNVTVSDDAIWYSLDPFTPANCNYPIQFAQITAAIQNLH